MSSKLTISWRPFGLLCSELVLTLCMFLSAAQAQSTSTAELVARNHGTSCRGIGFAEVITSNGSVVRNSRSSRGLTCPLPVPAVANGQALVLRKVWIDVTPIQKACIDRLIVEDGRDVVIEVNGLNACNPTPIGPDHEKYVVTIGRDVGPAVVKHGIAIQVYATVRSGGSGAFAVLSYGAEFPR